MIPGTVCWTMSDEGKLGSMLLTLLLFCICVTRRERSKSWSNCLAASWFCCRYRW